MKVSDEIYNKALDKLNKEAQLDKQKKKEQKRYSKVIKAGLCPVCGNDLVDYTKDYRDTTKDYKNTTKCSKDESHYSKDNYDVDYYDDYE